MIPAHREWYINVPLLGIHIREEPPILILFNNFRFPFQEMWIDFNLCTLCDEKYPYAVSWVGPWRSWSLSTVFTPLSFIFPRYTTGPLIPSQTRLSPVIQLFCLETMLSNYGSRMTRKTYLLLHLVVIRHTNYSLNFKEERKCLAVYYLNVKAASYGLFYFGFLKMFIFIFYVY